MDNKNDFKLKLLKGSSIYADNILIKPFTVGEIIDYGYSLYMYNLKWLLITKEDFIKEVHDESKKNILIKNKDNIKTFDFYIKLMGQNITNALISSIKMLFRTNDVIMLDNDTLAIDFVNLGIIYFDENEDMRIDKDKLEKAEKEDLKIINRYNFDEIIEIIQMQNYLKNIEEEDNYKFANDSAKELAEQMKKNQEKLAKAKKRNQQDDDEDVDFYSIISSVSSRSNSINKLNIWDLTVFQLYDEYARLEFIDNYDFSMKAILAGAKNVESKHWSSKI